MPAPRPRRYKEIAFLSGIDGHSKGITAIQFNSDATIVATAGLDGKVCLWMVQTGKLVHATIGKSPVTSLWWIEENIIFGSKDGNISMLAVSSDSGFSINGFWGHRNPVEHLAVDGDFLASGALNELKVWRRAAGAEYVLEVKLQGPPLTSYNDGKEVIVTSLHWTDSRQHDRLLMVTYMYHGAHLIETKGWSRVRTIPFPGGKIASASLSDNGAFVAISNLTKGFDVYRMETEEPVAFFVHEVGDPMPTPVLFTHGGRAIVGGSTVGKVNIWDVYSGKIHCLSIPKCQKVLAMAGSASTFDVLRVFCQAAPEPSDYRILLATGIFNQNSSSICIIWEAQEIDPNGQDEGNAPSESGTVKDSSRTVTPPSSRSTSFTARVFWWSGWIIIVAYCLLVLIQEGEW